uniref:Uncharacterized protein n=1 Tax=Neogobius melanostomus TaxID=47308 RepID=A0A8C6S6D9_9GOBI
MAEFSGGGVVAALLLFTALTVKDVYLGLNREHTRDQRSFTDEAEDGGRFTGEPERGRPAKTWSNTGSLGPVLRFQYWWVLLTDAAVRLCWLS